MPVLVHDGAVHIESNDIITYLEKAFPELRLIPEGHENQVAALLKHEDDLHFDLRGLASASCSRRRARRNRRRR